MRVPRGLRVLALCDGDTPWKPGEPVTILAFSRRDAPREERPSAAGPPAPSPRQLRGGSEGHGAVAGSPSRRRRPCPLGLGHAAAPLRPSRPPRAAGYCRCPPLSFVSGRRELASVFGSSTMMGAGVDFLDFVLFGVQSSS